MTTDNSSYSTFPRREKMIEIIKNNTTPIDRVELISFNQTCSRIAAFDVESKNTIPNAPVSRLDGIAVRYEDFANGKPDTTLWKEENEYIFANTGIAVPNQYDTVIPIEEVTILDKGIKIAKTPESRGELISPTGGNLKKGELLIAKGEVITPGHIGLFASGGILNIFVYAKPRIGIIPTGNELVNPTEDLPHGKNIDSNSYMIASYLEDLFAVPTIYPIAKDDKEIISNSINIALKENDAVIIIAGSSLGTKDFTISILKEMGEVIVQELAFGPGRKSSFSKVNGKPVFGVAGPPLGAQIACDLFLQAFISAMRGLPYIPLQKIEVTCDDSFQEHDVDFNERVHIYKSEDGYHVKAAFRPKLSRAEMQAVANGNYYREAGTSLAIGDKETVELLCPKEHIPDADKLSKQIKRRNEKNE